MKEVLILVFCFTLLGCTKEKEILNPNNIFSVSELVELNTIVDNFDKKTRENTPNVSLEESYFSFWGYPKSRQIPSENFIFSGVEELIELEVFDKIWFYYDTAKMDKSIVKFNPLSSYDEKDRSSKFRINYKPPSAYFILLNALGKENDYIRNYHTTVTAAGDCPPNISANFASNLDTYDYSDRNLRLFIAIHYLTEAHK